MRKCIYLRNGAKSNLYNTLLDITNNNESRATALYSHFFRPAFIQDFGNAKQEYLDGVSTNDRVDENGEPILFKDDNSNHYYINAQGERIVFPSTRKTLNSLLEAKDIRSAAHYLAMEYLTSTRNVNLENFDLSDITNTVDIKDFIKSKYQEKLKQLGESPKGRDRVTKKLLESTLDATDDWIPYITNFFKTISIRHVYDENNNDPYTLEEENTADPSFSSSSFEQDSKRNVRSLTKLKIATIKNPKGFNPLFGEAYLDYSESYNLLSGTLSDNYTLLDNNGMVMDVADEANRRLDQLSKKRPEFQNIISQAQNDDKFKRSLIATFKLQRNIILTNDYISKSYNEYDENRNATKNKTITHKERNVSDSASYEKGLLKTWNSNFYDKLFVKDSVSKRSKDEATKYVENIEISIQQLHSELNKSTENFDLNIFQYAETLSALLNDQVGTDIIPEAIVDFINEQENDLNAKQRFLGMLMNIKSDFINNVRSKHLSKAANASLVDYDFITHLKTFNQIAKKQAIYVNTASNANVFVGGKSAYLLSNIGYLKNKIETWKRNPQELQNFYDNSSEFQQSSVYLKHLLALDIPIETVDSYGMPLDPAEIARQTKLRNDSRNVRLQSFDTGILTDLFINEDNYKNEEDTTIQAASFEEYLVNDINKVVSNGFLRTTTAGDKKSNFLTKIGTFGSMRGFEGINTDSAENLININKELIDVFGGYFESEIVRNVKAKRTIDNLKAEIPAALSQNRSIDLTKLKVHYHFKKGSLITERNDNGLVIDFNIETLGNAFKSQLFPELSFKESDFKELSEQQLTDKEIRLSKLPFNEQKRVRLAEEIRLRIYDSSGNIKPELRDGKIFTTMKKSSIEGSIEDGDFNLKNLIEQYLANTLSHRIEGTHKALIDNNVISFDSQGNISSLSLDTQYAKKFEDFYAAKGVFKDASDYKAMGGYALATDYYLRSVINNVEYSKLFTGDMAFYKDMIDYKKRVPATYTDGLTLYLQPGEEYFNIAVIDGVEGRSVHHDKMLQTYGEAVAEKFNNINTTDAQAWITPQRWKFLLERLGKFDTPAHDSLYKKMMSGKEESYSVDELKIAAQPLKGVYFGINADGSPLYLKYSQAVLTPMLVKGTPLQAIYDKMTQQVHKSFDGQGKSIKGDAIDELITLDGVKVGSPATTRIHNDNNQLVEADKLYFNVMQASNRDWKLQQDLPTKTSKDTEVGSQIQKNIFAGLIHNREMEFDVDGKVMTADDIIKGITEEVTKLSDAGLKKLFQRFQITPNKEIANIDGFYEALIDELRSRGGSRNIINALEKRMSLFGIPQARSKINNMFASIVNKGVVKIKTNGASFIQMSNFGLSFDEASDSGVIIAPDAVPYDDNGNKRITSYEPYEYTDSETGRKRIKPGGVFMSGSLIAKYIPNYRDYSAQELFGYTDESGVFQNGMIDKKILDSIVGYRIPNQGLASNDALEIIGILPEENGDTIVAYTGITTKTGSDFDIDKMYLMIPTYKLEDVEGKPKLTYVQTEGEKGYHENRLIQYYKAVLTNPELISDIMLPIDFEFMKEDIVDLTDHLTGDTNDSLYHMEPLADIKLMYDFRNGKAGVGQEANWMVDISRLGELKISGLTNFNWFNSLNLESLSQVEKDTIKNYIATNELKLDNQYSMNLNEKDLQYYKNEVLLKKFSPAKAESILKEITNVKISSVMTAVLNGFVDIAKDPFITRGNWITSTTNTANFMLRTGIHPLYVNAFIANPIIRDYVSQSKGRDIGINDYLHDKVSKSLANKEIKNLQNLTYLTDVNLGAYYDNVLWNVKINETVDNKFKFNPDKILQLGKITKTHPEYEQVYNEAVKITNELNRLYDNVTHRFIADVSNTNEFDLEYFRKSAKSKLNIEDPFQIGVLTAFLEYKKPTKLLTDNMKISKSDTNGVGDNISNMLAITNLYGQLNTPKEGVNLIGMTSKLNNTPLQAYMKNLYSMFGVATNNPNLFFNLSQKNIHIMNTIGRYLGQNDITNTELLKNIEEALYMQSMNDFLELNAEEKLDLIKNLPERLKTKKEEHRGNLFVDVLINQKSYANGQNVISISANKRDAIQEDSLSDAWYELFQTDPKFAEDLIKYSFITTGFKNASGQFYTLIPHAYFLDKDINKFINTYETPQDFIIKFFENNLNKSFVYSGITRGSGHMQKMNIDRNGKKVENEDFIEYIYQRSVHDPEASKMYIIMYDQAPYMFKGLNDKGEPVYFKLSDKKISVGNKELPDYGDSLSNYIKKSANYLKYKTSYENYQSLVTNDAFENYLIGSAFQDAFTGANLFTPRPRVSNVNNYDKVDLFEIKTLDSENKLINMTRMFKKGSDINLGNPFTGSEVNGLIKINPLKLSKNVINDILNGKGDPKMLIMNREAAVKAYEAWLFYNDDSLVPADKLEELSTLRTKILEEVYNPNSELNKILDDNGKFAYMSDTVQNVKYRSHADVFADNVNQIRENRKLGLTKSNYQQSFEENQESTINNFKYDIFYIGDIKYAPNTIFVFGSNPEGRHGAGAAKIAKEQFGAIYGQGEGLQGNSYALPTKDLRIKENKGFKSISPQQIIENIKKMYNVAKQNQNKQFKIVNYPINKTSLNGYTGIEMIQMFNDAGVKPDNVIFSEEWFNSGLLKTANNVSDNITLLIDNKIKEISNTSNKNLIPYLLNYRQEVLESQTTMFPITQEDVLEFINKCI